MASTYVDRDEKDDWVQWFDGEGSQEAKRKLKESEYIDAPVLDKEVALKLAQIAKCDAATSERELREKLKTLSLAELQAYVAQEKDILEKEEATWRGKRRKGLKRLTTTLQSFTETFDRFLKGYSGVVEVARLADSLYGGAATASLAILFTTAMLKSSSDQSIQSAMMQIADRLPDFSIYQRIYANADLAVMLATAYTDIIVFAREATIYLHGHGARLQEQMLANFGRIRTKCETLLAKRVAELAQDNAELFGELRRVRNELKEAKGVIQALHTRKDEDAAKELNRFLGREISNSKEVRASRLSQNRRFLADLFDQVNQDFSTMTLQDLKQTKEYQTWERAKSSLLVLQGRNGIGLEQKLQHSWLSPCALDLIDYLRSSDNSNIVAYPKCGPQIPLEDVLKDIISEVVDLDRQTLRRGSDLQNIFLQLDDRGHAGSEDGGYRPIEGAAKALLTVTNRCRSPVHIVIDRPETCQREDRGHMWLFIKELLRMVKETTNQLRIVVVIRSDLWDISYEL
ncbi:hypothetical protein DL767_007180 [Monosporascus sp. MG133]|nr:hypothetical protein DL767_007180 [Monosporascus sp. MG133]